MKKLLYAAIAAIGLLLSPACSNEDELSNEALISFNVGVENGMQTKAGDTYTIGNADLINTLHVRVYYDNGSGGVGTEITDFAKNQEFIGTANLSFNLLRGQKYHFLFFADYQTTGSSTGTSPYTIQDGGAIKVSYDNAKCNDETRDAFVETLSLTATGSFTHSVKLRRPFAQLNFLTTADDIKAAAAGKIVNDIVTDGLSTNVTINNAATLYNPFTRKVSGSTQATFKVNKAPFTVTKNTLGEAASNYSVTLDNGTVTISGNTYHYLASVYFLVDTNNGTEANATTQTTLNNANLEVYDTAVPALDVPSAKVQQNFRTNIYGSLLTDPGSFKVTITPAFDDEYNEQAETENPELPADPVTVYVSSVEELTNALNTAQVIKLNEMIDLTTDLEVSRSVTIDGQNQTYGFTGAGSVVVKAPAEDAVTFIGVAFKNAADETAVTNKYALTSVQGIQCDITVENCVFANYTYGAVFLQPYIDASNAPGDRSTIIINGNSFSTPSNVIQGGYLKVCSTTTKDESLRSSWGGGAITPEPVTATLKILNNAFEQTENKVQYAIYTDLISRYTTYVGGNKITGETFDIFKTKLSFKGGTNYSLPQDFESMFTGTVEVPLETMGS